MTSLASRNNSNTSNEGSSQREVHFAFSRVLEMSMSNSNSCCDEKVELNPPILPQATQITGIISSMHSLDIDENQEFEGRTRSISFSLNETQECSLNVDSRESAEEKCFHFGLDDERVTTIRSQEIFNSPRCLQSTGSFESNNANSMWTPTISLKRANPIYEGSDVEEEKDDFCLPHHKRRCSIDRSVEFKWKQGVKLADE
mmetsp:Transcript_10388/g.11475  ORF Transcript_10388/g.11475 Transcript_10388/m.11475 type:complete len:201 (+) Transcript_10388:34-636(+)